MKKSKKRITKPLSITKLKHIKVLENIGKGMTMGDAAEAAGYSRVYADSGALKKTKEWNELLEEYLPDNLLAEEHKKLLKLSKIDHMVFPVSVEEEEIEKIITDLGCVVKKFQFGEQGTHVWYYVPDGLAKKNALDMAYKLKARYDNTITVKGKLGQLSDEEIEDRIAREVSAVIGAIAGEGEASTDESSS